jgi:hypothetical protein
MLKHVPRSWPCLLQSLFFLSIIVAACGGGSSRRPDGGGGANGGSTVVPPASGGIGGSGTTGAGGIKTPCLCPAGYACDDSGVCAGGKPMGLVLDVVAYTVSGSVTLNGASPEGNSECNPTYGVSRGAVTWKELTSGVSIRMELQGCGNGEATFSGQVFPGTYQVVVGSGGGSNLPPAGYVVKSSLLVNAALSDLTLDVPTYPVSGNVTLNGANPIGTSTSMCEANASFNTTYNRGQVVFTDIASKATFYLDLQGCGNGPATFSGQVFPGTYRVIVYGNASDLPLGGSVVKSSLLANAALSDLTLDVVPYAVSGSVTLNGANPEGNSDCNPTYGISRGTVRWKEVTSGVTIIMDLQGCGNGKATFSGQVVPGTYQVMVGGSGGSNLPPASYVAKSSLPVNTALSDLTLDVPTYPVSGSVTLNGANPVSTSTSCEADAIYNRGVVVFTDIASHATFFMELQGCGNSKATFSGQVLPGTYQVIVNSNASNLPLGGAVAAYQLKVP